MMVLFTFLSVWLLLADAYQSGAETDFSPALLMKDLERLSCHENPVFREISVPDTFISHDRNKGRYFTIRCSSGSSYFAYIGRVNSCRTGGCNNLTEGQADSYEYFDYYILYDRQNKINLVRVYNYRATHGQEITSRGWLRQFAGYDGSKALRVGREVDSITGATISVNGIVSDIITRTKILREIELLVDQE